MHGKLKDGEGVSFHGGCGFTCHSRFVVRSPPVPSLSSGSRDDEDTAEPARRSKDDTHRRQEQQPSPLAPTPPASTPPTRSPQPAPSQPPATPPAPPSAAAQTALDQQREMARRREQERRRREAVSVDTRRPFTHAGGRSGLETVHVINVDRKRRLV